MSSSDGGADTGAPVASPERPASTSPPPGGDKGAGVGPSPLVIGKSFIKQYYKVLSSSPEHIHKFYKSSSCISHGLEPSVPATTITLSDLDDISEVRTKLFSWAEPADDGSVVTLDFERGAIDAQVSVGGGVLLVVTGVMTLPGSSGVGKPFIHTFFLNSMTAGKRKQYYVHNDVLRFLSGPDMSHEVQEEVAVEVGVEEVAPAAAEVEAKGEKVAETVETPAANGAPLPGLAPMPTDGALVGEVPPPAQDEPVVPAPPVTIEPAVPMEREEAVPEMKDGEEAPPALEEEEAVAPAVPEAQDRPEPDVTAEIEEPASAGGGKPPKQGGRGDRRQKKRSGKRGGANSRSSSPTEKAQHDGGKPSPAKSDKEETPTQADSAAPPKQPQAAPVPAPAPAPAPPPTPPKPKTPGSWASLVAGGPQPASPMSQPPAPTPAAPMEKEDDGAGGAEETKTDKGAEETKAGEESISSEKPPTPSSGGGAPQRRDQRVPPRSSRHRPQSTDRVGGSSGGGRVPNATLFIKNIPDSTKESDIRGLFEPQAARTGHRILSITLNPNRGFCFVDFDGPEAVATVLKENISSQVKDESGRITSTAFMVNGRMLDVEKKTGQRMGGGRSYHRSASPGNGMGYKGGRGGGHPRRTSPRGGGGGRRSGGGR